MPRLLGPHLSPRARADTSGLKTKYTVSAALHLHVTFGFQHFVHCYAKLPCTHAPLTAVATQIWQTFDMRDSSNDAFLTMQDTAYEGFLPIFGRRSFSPSRRALFRLACAYFKKSLTFEAMPGTHSTSSHFTALWSRYGLGRHSANNTIDIKV